MLHHIPSLMDRGKPVSILLTGEEGVDSPLLYCELIQRARFGESFLIKNQSCEVGAYVLGTTETNPSDYYHRSERYKDRNTAKRAVASLHRITEKTGAMKITPYSGEDFDILILFLNPERAMRLVQAYTYNRGDPLEIKTGGIASVCSDCTAYPMHGKLAISPGCKGSRKHSRYADEELVIGIPFELACEIDQALEKIPETLA